MTKEEKVLKIITAYQEDKDNLSEIYEHFYRIAPMNDYGEVDADFIIMLNEWHKKKLSDLDKYLASEINHIS